MLARHAMGSMWLAATALAACADGGVYQGDDESTAGAAAGQPVAASGGGTGGDAHGELLRDAGHDLEGGTSLVDARAAARDAAADSRDEIAPSKLQRVLVFTRTTGFRHRSIQDGVAMMRALGQRAGFAVEHTEDEARFTDAGLSAYDVVVWLNTTGTPLGASARSAFERFIRGGGGYVGIHAASDTWGGRNNKVNLWPWYGQLLGGNAFFASHPASQDARVVVETRDGAATRHLGASFTLNDEWYNFEQNPRAVVTVLLSLDESSYQGGAMDGDHPISWYHVFDGGRAFYTGMGHRAETFKDHRFQQHILAALVWTGGGTW